MKEQVPPIIYEDNFFEKHRIAWRVEHGVPDPANPLLEGEYPWDDTTVAVGHGSLQIDPIDGKFKGWTPVMSGDTPERVGECEFRLAYIESDDGVNWRRPQLDLCSWPGHERTNLIFDNDSGGRTTFASVLIDPEENPGEPYEMFCFREVHWSNPERLVAGFNQTPAKDDIDVWKYYGLYRYRSPDGLHWRGVEGPIKLKTGDACYVYRDPNLGYVAHHKSTAPLGPGNVVPYECYDQCRVAMRRSSPDGTNWTDSVPLMAPDWRDSNGDQIMEVGRYPYGDGYVGFVTMYHAVSQQIDVQFSVSADGENFWRPIPRVPCLPNSPLGDYGGGMIWPYRLPIELDGRLYLYYGALAGLHGDIYSKVSDMRFFRSGALCRSSWDMGRFFAAVNVDGEGSNAPGVSLPGMTPNPDGIAYPYLTSVAEEVDGKTLYLNAATMRGGEIYIELLNDKLQPIPGFSKDDFSPYQGDDSCLAVSWKGGSCPESGNVHTRVYMTTAKLYGFAWR